MSVERAEKQTAARLRSVTMPGQAATRTGKDPKEIAAEIRVARLAKRTEAAKR
jgi:hypothetical protein